MLKIKFSVLLMAVLLLWGMAAYANDITECV